RGPSRNVRSKGIGTLVRRAYFCRTQDRVGFPGRSRGGRVGIIGINRGPVRLARRTLRHRGNSRGSPMNDVRRVTSPNRRHFLLGSAGGLASYAMGLSPGLAQPLQSTARILVGFPPGGPTDVVARLFAEQMK